MDRVLAARCKSEISLGKRARTLLLGAKKSRLNGRDGEEENPRARGRKNKVFIYYVSYDRHTGFSTVHNSSKRREIVEYENLSPCVPRIGLSYYFGTVIQSARARERVRA